MVASRVNESELVSWDSGGASFQVAAMYGSELRVFEGLFIVLWSIRSLL